MYSAKGLSSAFNADVTLDKKAFEGFVLYGDVLYSKYSADTPAYIIEDGTHLDAKSALAHMFQEQYGEVMELG